MNNEFKPALYSLMYTAACIILWNFAPVADGRFNWPAYHGFIPLVIWNAFYFIPVIICSLVSGSIHYFNAWGFLIGILIESYLLTKIASLFIKWPKVE